ncbi:hypothetical protein [Streptomyces yaizuensis]|uniref:Uncharacterized protein n=1 Tax=Streptomyces yaizuensis TaxID=2989713 RepID=A0ABQ5NU55_9ACTN|nr:hypothetical protein [Streptomyces sp. YSPA8]GLF93897.1 hypothetical protein SYYSPA8_06390 [Streptomyces sp. YSPA8]
MARPQGAHTVNYLIWQRETGSDGPSVSFSLPLDHDPDLMDALAEAAAQGMVDKLKALNPTIPVRVGRGYDCKVPGAPWPTNPA